MISLHVTLDVTRLVLEPEMLDHAIRILLFPILVSQGVLVRRSALHLDDLSGRRHGVRGQGPDLRLLIIGDSSAVGIGNSHQEEALLGHMRKRLSQTTMIWNGSALSSTTAAASSSTHIGGSRNFRLKSVMKQ